MNENERQRLISDRLKDLERIYGKRNLRVISVPVHPSEGPTVSQMRKASVNRFLIEEIDKTGSPQVVMDEGGLLFPRHERCWHPSTSLCLCMPTEQAIMDAYKETKAKYLEG